MFLEHLLIEHVRNIEKAEIYPGPGLNIIVGNNAAGKTSILESIDILSRGRSFRTRHSKNFINKKKSVLTVAGRITDHGQSKIQLGIEKSRTKTRIHFCGASMRTIAKNASKLPVQVIHPQSHNLIQGSSSFRRSFIDWGVFHVEHNFLEFWQDYNRVLKQRNASLKMQLSNSVSNSWDKELSEKAYYIDKYRQSYFNELFPTLSKYISEFLGGVEVQIEYKRGWKNDISLFDELLASYNRDKKFGYTHFGPHRADLKIFVNQFPAADFISRGQQKLLASACILSQLYTYQRILNNNCVCLIDDLPSELDLEHRNILLESLKQIPAQIFITTINPDWINDLDLCEKKMFHVKQGIVKDLL